MTEVDLRIPYGNFEKDRSIHLKYHGYDDLYKYNINSDILKNTNWLWLTNDIDYKFNNQGFRCDFDFDDNFDFSNYVVFVGCSHVAGLGNQANSTVPALFESITNQPVINMGIGGASNEVIFQNIIWLMSRKHRPKRIVVCWTSLYRDLWFRNDMSTEFLNANLADRLQQSEFKDYVYPRYFTSYIERTSLAHFEMVSRMKEIGVYAFNFFSTYCYDHLENTSLRHMFLDKFNVGSNLMQEYLKNRNDQMQRAFMGEIDLVDLLNSDFGRDITRLDPNLKLSNVTAHQGPVPNKILANFVSENIDL
ncbi:hypothetical protein N9I00_00275 [bacterium]|nr:hypothetical protein [bacterium]